jgi:GAF domain-containing protein
MEDKTNHSTKLEQLYARIYNQLQDLLGKSPHLLCKMATICALLHHKLNHFFWTGFYILINGQLCIGPYQGSLACQVLEKAKGVCWAGIKAKKTIIVPDVHQFPGHIACDSRSNSEIVIPLFDFQRNIWGVLDVDSRQFNAFSEIDQLWLEKIVQLLTPTPEELKFLSVSS